MLERMEVTFGPGSLLYGSDALGGVVHFRSKEPKLNFDKIPGSYRLESNFYTRYASANEEKSAHVDFNFGKTKWASLTSFTFTDYGDMRAGNNRPVGYEHFGRRLNYVQRVDGIDQTPENVTLNADSSFSDNSNVQIGTAYSQMDFTQKIKFQPNEHSYQLLNFQFSTTSDVPRYDVLTEQKSSDPKNLKWAEWFYGPQKRLLASLKMRYSKPTKYFDKATIIGSYQRLEEDRLKRKLNNLKRVYNLANVNVVSLTADFDKSLDSLNNKQVMYGMETNLNDVNATAGSLVMSTERVIIDELTRYPGNSNKVVTGAFYGNFRVASKDSALVANAGLRFTVASLRSKFGRDSIIIWPDKYYNGINNTHADLTWSGGLAYSTKDKFQARAMLSKAFRSPNLDDFSKIDEKNEKVTIPNPNLVPETSINAEFSMAKQFGEIKQGQGTAVTLRATGYHTWIKNLIVRRGFALPDGSNQLAMGFDTLETVANVNAAKGFIYGASFNADLNIGQRLKLSSGIHFTKGKESLYQEFDNGLVLDTLVPASHIPPTYGNTSLTYTGKKFTASLFANYFGRKPVEDYGVVLFKLDEGELVPDRLDGSDNIELSYTTAGYFFKEITENGERRLEPTCNNPDSEGNCEGEYVGTLAYTTFNFYTSWQITKQLRVNFAVENITDLHYRPFASGMSGAGRNFILSLRAGFGK